MFSESDFETGKPEPLGLGLVFEHLFSGHNLYELEEFNLFSGTVFPTVTWRIYNSMMNRAGVALNRGYRFAERIDLPFHPDNQILKFLRINEINTLIPRRIPIGKVSDVIEETEVLGGLGIGIFKYHPVPNGFLTRAEVKRAPMAGYTYPLSGQIGVSGILGKEWGEIKGVLFYLEGDNSPVVPDGTKMVWNSSGAISLNVPEEKI